MRDVDRALSEIASIKSQLAAGALFRGFGPAVIAVTGALALVTAGAQSLWPAVLVDDPVIFFGCWIGIAVLSAGLIGAEMHARSRRLHGGLADAMIVTAIERFVPAGAAGAAIAAVMFAYAPDTLWVLPGLWQILAALGIFAAARTLPRAVALVGGWYFVAGVAVLIAASAAVPLSPWMMGLPFAVGQGLLAAVLHFADGETDDRP